MPFAAQLCEVAGHWDDSLRSSLSQTKSWQKFKALLQQLRKRRHVPRPTLSEMSTESATIAWQVERKPQLGYPNYSTH